MRTMMSNEVSAEGRSTCTDQLWKEEMVGGRSEVKSTSDRVV